MKLWLLGIPFLMLSSVACSDDTAADPDLDRCNNIADQIRTVADKDEELKDYQGADRRLNPCADPIPVTSGTDYSPPCEEIRGCPNELK